MPRRFPLPWSIIQTHACFAVRDENGQALRGNASFGCGAKCLLIRLCRQVGRSEHLGANGSLPVPLYIVGMCGRATYELTWEEIVALCRLALGQRHTIFNGDSMSARPTKLTP
jgi:hypothetical protein